MAVYFNDRLNIVGNYPNVDRDVIQTVAELSDNDVKIKYGQGHLVYCVENDTFYKFKLGTGNSTVDKQKAGSFVKAFDVTIGTDQQSSNYINITISTRGEIMVDNKRLNLDTINSILLSNIPYFCYINRGAIFTTPNGANVSLNNNYVSNIPVKFSTSKRDYDDHMEITLDLGYNEVNICSDSIGTSICKYMPVILKLTTDAIVGTNCFAVNNISTDYCNSYFNNQDVVYVQI